MGIGNANFIITLFILPLIGLDVVLGVEWLAQLVPTMCDWKVKKMEFNWAGKRQIIHGLKSQKITQAH